MVMRKNPVVEKTSDSPRTVVVVAEVQNAPGAGRCVLLLGYGKKMRGMFQNVNPGFTQRFPLD